MKYIINVLGEWFHNFMGIATLLVAAAMILALIWMVAKTIPAPTGELVVLIFYAAALLTPFTLEKDLL